MHNLHFTLFFLLQNIFFKNSIIMRFLIYITFIVIAILYSFGLSTLVNFLYSLCAIRGKSDETDLL